MPRGDFDKRVRPSHKLMVILQHQVLRTHLKGGHIQVLDKAHQKSASPKTVKTGLTTTAEGGASQLERMTLCTIELCALWCVSYWLALFMLSHSCCWAHNYLASSVLYHRLLTSSLNSPSPKHGRKSWEECQQSFFQSSQIILL